jgi:type VI secretion system protein ImpC
VANLLRDMVSPFIVPAAKPEKAGLLATVDAAIADALRALLHQSDFQAAESLWRGVDFLLRRLETGPMLQVHLIDVSAEEWAVDLSSASDLAESGLYQLLVACPAEGKDGGYACIAGLYQLEASPPHAELLGRMAKIANAAAAPFITAVDERPWLTRDEPHPLVTEAFAELRQLPESDRLLLLGPRFLMRHPYGRRTDPLSSLAFEEFTAHEGLGGLLWGHPAWLALTALFGQKGQPVVADLPFHTFVDADGDSTALPCTERIINIASATRLGVSGITAVMAHRGEPSVRLAGLNAVSGQPLATSAVQGRQLDRGGVKLVAGGASPSARATPSTKAATRASSTSDSDDLDALMAKASGDDETSSSSSDDLDALLAGLSDDRSSSSEGGDSSDDLDALLASLGSDDSASSGSDESSMDSDLDALLKSLG